MIPMCMSAGASSYDNARVRRLFTPRPPTSAAGFESVLEERYQALRRWLASEAALHKAVFMDQPLPTTDFAKVKALWDFALERTSTEYDELTDTWKSIDAKSQATTAASGILIAAIAALAKGADAQIGLPWAATIGLVFSVFCLLVAIGLSLSAMRVKELEMPVTGTTIRDEVLQALDDNAHQPDIGLESHLVDLVAATQEHWAAVNADFARRTLDKGNKLSAAQVALAAALFACAVIVLCYLISLAVADIGADPKRQQETSACHVVVQQPQKATSARSRPGPVLSGVASISQLSSGRPRPS